MKCIAVFAATSLADESDNGLIYWFKDKYNDNRHDDDHLWFTWVYTGEGCGAKWSEGDGFWTCYPENACTTSGGVGAQTRYNYEVAPPCSRFIPRGPDYPDWNIEFVFGRHYGPNYNIFDSHIYYSGGGDGSGVQNSGWVNSHYENSSDWRHGYRAGIRKSCPGENFEVISRQSHPTTAAFLEDCFSACDEREMCLGVEFNGHDQCTSSKKNPRLEQTCTRRWVFYEKISIIDTAHAEVCDEKEGGCGLCEGDCDRDAHCQDGLVCFKRDGFEPVPGCHGSGTSNWDYCVEATTGIVV